MPDGLRLYPLDGGKLEIVQELFPEDNEEELSDEDLGNSIFFIYASRYDEIKELSLEEIAEAGSELSKRTTLEDKQAAEEVIVADFDALQASLVRTPKAQAREKEVQSRLAEPVSSGPDSLSVTQEPNSTRFPQSKSCSASLPKPTPTDKTGSASSGNTATRKILEPQVSGLPK